MKPKDQTRHLKNFIDYHLSFLGSAATPEHDPQLRGIATLQSLLERLGDRHEERAQVLSHLLLKVNENDLAKDVHRSTPGKIAAGSVFVGIGTVLVAASLFNFGLSAVFGVKLIKDGMKFIRSQDEAVNLGIKVASDELEHARKRWTDVGSKTKTALINNYGTMVTNFKKSASEDHGKVFTYTVSDKYKNPENFSKWNAKSAPQKDWSKLKEAHRPVARASLRDAVIDAAERLQHGEEKKSNVLDRSR